MSSFVCACKSEAGLQESLLLDSILGMYCWAIKEIAQQDIRYDGQRFFKEAKFHALQAAHVGREYHNWEHITNKLGWTLKLAIECELPSKQLAENILADFYHDAVYDSRSKTNEKDSALLFLNDMNMLCGEDPALRDSTNVVQALIVATANHRVYSPSVQMQIMIDSDLAILQSPSGVYDKYAANIRREYSWVDDKAYREGRTAVLKSFLSEPIYFNQAVFNEKTASDNIQREIEALANDNSL